MLSSFNLEKTYQFLLIALAFLMPLTVFGGNLIIVLIAVLGGVDQAAKILGDMAAVYFVSVAAIVAAFFGTQAMNTKKK